MSVTINDLGKNFVIGHYYLNKNFLIMRLVDEADKLRKSYGMRCVAMISSLLPQYSLLTGKLVGPVLESALGPRVMGSLK